MADPTPCKIHGRLMLSPATGGKPVCDYCVAVAAENERIEALLQAELDALVSGAKTCRFLGLSPAGLLDEVIAAIRRAPEPGAEEEKDA